MKRSPKLYSILLFIGGLCCFLLSEVYFFLNPMFDKFDFFDMYFIPLILYLLSLGATVGLSRIDHPIAKRLLDALCLAACAIMLGVNMCVFAEDHTVQVLYYPYNLSLWLSLSLIFSSVFTTALALQSDMKTRPRFCCVLLFVLTLCSALLSGFSFLTSPDFGLDYPGWYLGQLLLFMIAIGAVIILNRIEHASARPFMIALACIASVAAVAVFRVAGTSDIFLAHVHSKPLTLCFALPLAAFSIFVWRNVWRKNR